MTADELNGVTIPLDLGKEDYGRAKIAADFNQMTVQEWVHAVIIAFLFLMDGQNKPERTVTTP